MKPRAISLNFHGIGLPKRKPDPGEAPYWVTEEQFNAVLNRVAGAPDPSEYEITFDDGNLSDHDIALPALAARGLTARFFVLAGRLGQTGSLGAEHVRAIADAGMVIGSHGIDHVPWTGLDDASLKRELADSRARLENICGRPVTEAGIPFGRYDARVLRALRAAGYSAAWSSDGGCFSRKAFLRPRTSLRGDMDAEQITHILENRAHPIRRLRRAVGMARRRWLVTG